MRSVACAIARVSIAMGVVAGLLVSMPAPAAAAQCVWTGAGGDARWSNPANWTNCPGPVNGDLLRFPAGATPVSVNDIVNLRLTAIQIEGLPSVSNYVITGLGVTMFSPATVRSEAPALPADGQGVYISLPITIEPSPSGTSVLDVVNLTSLEMTGAIVGNAMTEVRKFFVGELILGSPNNAWNQLAIDRGIVRLAAAGALPANSRLVMSGHSQDTHLYLDGFDVTLSYLSSVNPFPAPFVPPTVFLESATLTVASGSFQGRILNTGNLVKTGTGELTLGGPASNTYEGTTTVNGGTLRVLKDLAALGMVGPVIVNAGGKLLLDFPEQIANEAPVTVNAGGTLELSIVGRETIGSLDGGGTILLNHSAFVVGGNGRSTTFSGSISGGYDQQTFDSFVKEGTGTLTLTGVLSYEGETLLQAGTLLVNGVITGPGTAVTVYGGILGGVGTIARNIQIFKGGGSTALSPGASPGILTVAGAAVEGTYDVEINGPIAGQDYDQLNVTTGKVGFLGAALRASLAYGPPAGTQFTIVKSPAGPTHAVAGSFVGLPEGAELQLRDQPFRISYRGGAGNDVVLTALDGPPVLSIDDVTITEGNEGTTQAVFTVALSHAIEAAVGVQYTIENGSAFAPADYTAQGGTLVFLPGTTTQTVTVAVTGDRDVEPDETFAVRLFGLSGASAAQGIASIGKARGAGIIASDDAARTYYLAEGATGSFFDMDVLIANPNATIAPVTLTFLKQDGEQVVTQRSIGAWSHVTVHADLIPGLESTAASVTVTSESGVPLMVERTMFWDAAYRAGHTGSSVDQPSRDWLFAEGSQGFFSTFVLVANPNDTAADVTFTFLLESGDPVVVTRTLGPTSRVTLGAGDIPALADRSFGIAVHATQPVMAERSMYFGAASAGTWSGGAESAGVTSASTHWFLAEGATGDFFDTFILLGNPESEPAHVTVKYLLDFGEVITVPKVVPANGRLTIDIEGESDPRLHDAAVSTVVTSDRPIIAERSMYWAGLPWREAHNSFGVAELGPRWALAEGRVGGPRNFHTFVLLANPQTDAAHVTVTYLREEGAPLVRQYVVPPTSRFNIDVNAIVPEMRDESFGTLIEVTNGVPIAAERSMYWDAQGVFWSGGTNATGMRLQ